MVDRDLHKTKHLDLNQPARIVVSPKETRPATHRLTPFDTIIESSNPALLVDDILPAGNLLTRVSTDVLNCFINYVDLSSVIVERDPEEDERYISNSNQFYTHFHEFGTVIHVVASSEIYWWYFCYDIDSSDSAIGRQLRTECSLPQMVAWVYQNRVSRTYPSSEIDIRKLRGWRSFQ